MGKLYLALALAAFVRLAGFVTEPMLDAREIHRAVGEAARVTSSPAPDRLKIVTWNIERGAAYDNVLSALRALNADVLLLQEVDRACRRTRFRDVAGDLARALDMNW